ncbi:MAG: DUF72 domain-containing protein [Firmicutes bacterium]|nr:DUF72 domain-containing protein [Bacillota bacterium]
MIRVGTCSWTDPTLLNCGRFYPPEAKTAEARLRFYAKHFDTVEVNSSYYHLPAERNSHLWVERTPAGFIFNIKAYKSLTLHERGKQPDELEWRMFASAIAPLHAAGKLGYVLFQFPPWFTCTLANQAYILECQERLPDYRLAIQFRHPSWLASRAQAIATLRWLKQHNLPYVAVDEPQFPTRRTIPPVAVATVSDLAVVRFNGRNLRNWFAKGIPVHERFHYLYSPEELAAWVEPIKRLATQAQVVYVMFNNCFADDAIVNAKEILRQLLAS